MRIELVFIIILLIYKNSQYLIYNKESNEEKVFIIKLPIKNELKNCCIIDTKREDEIQLEEIIRCSHGFILVFSLNDNESFEKIKIYVEEIEKFNGIKSIPIILVGNKADLENERQVKYDKANEFANLIGAIYYEHNSLDNKNHNFKNIFQKFVKKIIIKNNEDLQLYNHKYCNIL